MKSIIVLVLFFTVISSVIFPLVDSNVRWKRANDRWKPLIEAAQQGNEIKVRELVKNGANVNLGDEHEYTALYYAAQRGDLNIARFLVQNGADVNKLSQYLESPLIAASREDKVEVAELLLQNGANIEQSGNNRYTPLLEAASHGSAKVVKLLLEHGANVNAMGSNPLVGTSGYTPLYWAAVDGNEQIVEMLIRYGASSNSLRSDGYSMLQWTVANGHDKIVDMLILNGADVNLTDKDGESILHWAARHGRTKIGDLLIQCGANVDAVSKEGDTPLHYAVDRDKAGFVKMLIRNNANRNIKNNDGKTPIDLARDKSSSGNSLISRLLSRNSIAEKACDVYSQVFSNRPKSYELAKSGEFPWMAVLGYLDTNYTASFDCAVTILSNFYVLSAAHCITDKHQPVVVRIGRLTSSGGAEIKAESIQIQEIKQHPFYSEARKKNDIALIRVAKPMYFSDTVRPACLQTDLNDENSDVPLTMTGWEKVSTEREFIAPFMCYSRLRVTILPGSDLARVVGLYSFGYDSPSPTIYTRIAYYVNWIESYVWPGTEIATPSVYFAKS